MTSKIKENLCLIICIFIMALLFLYSKDISLGIKQGINISLNTLIPSMYIFMVLACFINYSGVDKVLGKMFNFLSTKLFKVNGEIFSIFLISAIGGYPIGAKIIADKISIKSLSDKDGEYILNFCVFASPAFLISGISIPMFNTAKVGIIIVFSQIITSLLFAFIMSFKLKENIEITHFHNEISMGENLINAVNSATKSIIVICSYVIIFYGFFTVFDTLLPSSIHKDFLKGILEVTAGCTQIKPGNLINTSLMINIFTSFGGICVLMQLSSILKNTKVSLKKFVFIRIIFTIVSTVITYILLKSTNLSVQCINGSEKYTYKIYTVSPTSSIFLLILGVMLLLFWNKSVKIKYGD